MAEFVKDLDWSYMLVTEERKQKRVGDTGKDLECSPNLAFFLIVREQMGVERAPL